MCSFSQTWTAQTSGTSNDLKSISWQIGTNTWVAVGNSGTFLKTTNAGNWIKMTVPTGSNLNSTFIEENMPYSVGNNGTILKYTTLQTSGTTANLNSVYFVNSTVGYAVGDGFGNGGTNSTQQKLQMGVILGLL